MAGTYVYSVSAQAVRDSERRGEGSFLLTAPPSTTRTAKKKKKKEISWRRMEGASAVRACAAGKGLEGRWRRQWGTGDPGAHAGAALGPSLRESQLELEQEQAGQIRATEDWQAWSMEHGGHGGHGRGTNPTLAGTHLTSRIPGRPACGRGPPSKPNVGTSTIR